MSREFINAALKSNNDIEALKEELIYFFYKDKSKPELSDMISWWRRDGGSFNTELYIKICVIKSQLR